jgi:hypothetical protein
MHQSETFTFPELSLFKNQMLQFKEITLLATEIYFMSLSRLSTETKGLAAHADMKGERGGRHQPPG